MATVRLKRNGHDEITDLPLVCMECGAEAARTRSTFYMRTIWRRQRVAMPLCDKHWLCAHLEKVIGIVCSLTPSVLLLVQIVLAPLLPPIDRHLFFWWSPALLLCVSLSILLNWLILSSRIKLKKLTDTVIELTGVAPQFVAALEQEAVAHRENFASEVGKYFNSSAAGDERILPSGDDNYQAKP